MQVEETVEGLLVEWVKWNSFGGKTTEVKTSRDVILQQDGETLEVQEAEIEDDDTMSVMQRGRSYKRARSPAPRRRRIPARPSGRAHHPVPDRLHQRARWMRAPSRPTSASTVSRVPWRCRRDTRDQRAREEASEAAEEVNLTGEASGSHEHAIPLLDDGTRVGRVDRTA